MKNLSTKLKLFLILGLFPGLAFASIRAFNSSGLDLGIFTDLKCSTNVSCAKTGGQLVVSATSASLSLASGESIVNSVDDTVEVKSDDEATIFRVEGFEAKAASLQLASDDGDDAADVYELKVDTSDVLTLLNGVTDLGTVSSVGDRTFKGTTPYLTIGDNDAEDSGLVFDEASLDFNISVDSSAGTLVLGKGTAAGTTDALRIDTSQVVTVVKNLAGSAASLLYGFSQKQVASTTTSITSSQCGQTFINDSADVMNLPEASTVLGCRLTFVCGNAGDFDINPADGTDTIGPVYTITGSNTTAVLAPSAGDAIRCTDLGMSITLEAISADLWYVIGAPNGVWTDVN